MNFNDKARDITLLKIHLHNLMAFNERLASQPERVDWLLQRDGIVTQIDAILRRLGCGTLDSDLPRAIQLAGIHDAYLVSLQRQYQYTKKLYVTLEQLSAKSQNDPRWNSSIIDASARMQELQQQISTLSSTDVKSHLGIAEPRMNYSSCFISYASADHACAERLHADLQNKGVQCWFAPHSMEIGIPILRGIDEAIRIYDKLLLILSGVSVNSRWVEFEVNQALQREIEEDRSILFPIRLDDTVLQIQSGWAAQVRTRNIGDFRDWQNHETYQAAFTRLLQDLKLKG